MKDFLKFHLRHNFLLEKEIKKINNYFQLDSLAERQNEEFLKIIEAAKNTKFYPEFYEKNEVDIHQIHSLDDLEKLPILRKEHIKENPILFFSKKKNITSTKGYTSGSTGSPLVVYRDFKSILKENAYVWWYRKRSGLAIKDKKLSLRGDLGRDKLFYFGKYANTLFISSYHLNEKNLPKIIDKIIDFKPKALLAYPSSAYTLATLLESASKKLIIPLVFTSSESLLEFQKDKIQECFHAKVFDWYGTAERTIALYSENEKYYEPPLYSVNEYKSDKIITTGLINKLFPLIRYEVNDVVQHQNKYDDKHKSLEIDEIQGRVEDYVLLPDGSKIGRMDVAFKGINGIKKAQLIQHSVSEIEILLVTDHFETAEKVKLQKQLTDRLGSEIKIIINEVQEEDLQKSKNKKFKFVISKIN